VILGMIEETPDLTIEELRQALAKEGLIVGYGTIRRFFARNAITRRKDCACGRARPARHPKAAQGMVRRPARARPRSVGVHRRDLGFDQHGAISRLLSTRRTLARRRSSRPLEEDDSSSPG
jgi:hypothetical protein